MRTIIRRRFRGRRAIARLFLVAVFVRQCQRYGLLPRPVYRLKPSAGLFEPPAVHLPTVSFLPLDLISGYDCVGFSGSRIVSPTLAYLVRKVADWILPEQTVAVGCAKGVDSIVRDRCPWARVFSVESGLFGSGASAYARRSVAVIEFVERSRGLWISFPTGAIPRGLAPSKYWVSASGSGSWGSLAVAVGRGVPCLLFAPSAPAGWGFQKLASDWWFFPGSKAEPEPEQLSLFF